METKQTKIMPIPRLSVSELLPILSKHSKFGFSGSRERCFPEDREVVHEIVDALPKGSTVVSGQCNSLKRVILKDKESGIQKAVELVNENTDRWSVARAASRGLNSKEFPPTYPELPGIKERIAQKLDDPRSAYWYVTNRNYARNVDIVDNSDMLLALVNEESAKRGGNMIKRGGSWHTVKYALSVGKPVFANLKGEKGWIPVSKVMISLDTIYW